MFLKTAALKIAFEFNFIPGASKHNSKKCKKMGLKFYITFTLKSGRCDIMSKKPIWQKLAQSLKSGRMVK